ncbi:MAG: hypothetical protein WCV50_02555 [Patescibacteria group bacterium]|jgi:hypothetical protein
MTRFLVKKYNSEKEMHLGNKAKVRLTINRMSLNVILLILIVCVGFSYLYYINRTATGGFDMKGLEISIAELQKENKSLTIKTAELRSMTSIERAGQELNMVATTRIEYLPAAGTSVASR